MAELSMRSRRLRAWIVLMWMILTLVLVAGVIVAFTASQTAGVALFAVGAAGYLALGAIVFLVMPRRG